MLNWLSKRSSIDKGRRHFSRKHLVDKGRRPLLGKGVSSSSFQVLSKAQVKLLSNKMLVFIDQGKKTRNRFILDLDFELEVGFQIG